jgi:anti-anti-sigma factor
MSLMPQPLAEFDVCWHAATAVVRLVGEIDRLNADELRIELQNSTGHKERLILDAGALTYLDCAALTTIHKLLLTQPNLILVAPPGCRARRLLEIAGMDTVLSIVDTTDAAMNEARGQMKSNLMGLFRTQNGQHSTMARIRDKPDTTELDTPNPLADLYRLICPIKNYDWLGADIGAQS